MSEATPTTDPQTGTAVPDMLREFRQVMDERVRRETRRMRRRAQVLGWTAVVLALVALVSTAGLLYFAFYQGLPVLASPSLRAQEIVLVDADGTERGFWAVDGEGTARLLFLDPDGVQRLKLTVRADGEQGVSMADGQGTNRVVLGHLADRSSTLAFADDGGVTRAVLGMSAGGATSLLFADASGGTRAALGLAPDGEATFWWPEIADGAAGPPDNP